MNDSEEIKLIRGRPLMIGGGGLVMVVTFFHGSDFFNHVCLKFLMLIASKKFPLTFTFLFNTIMHSQIKTVHGHDKLKLFSLLFLL